MFRVIQKYSERFINPHVHLSRRQYYRQCDKIRFCSKTHRQQSGSTWRQALDEQLLFSCVLCTKFIKRKNKLAGQFHISTASSSFTTTTTTTTTTTSGAAAVTTTTTTISVFIRVDRWMPCSLVLFTGHIAHWMQQWYKSITDVFEKWEKEDVITIMSPF